MTRSYTLSLLFFVFALVIYGLFEWRISNDIKTRSLDTELTPDFIAEKLKNNTYDKNGNLSYTIDAERMEHYADLAVTHFEFPKYTLHPKNNESPWQVSAKEGTLFNNNRVSLKDRVRLIATDQSSLIREIQGKYLELDLNTNIISSEQTILIQGKGFTMYGSGLIVDLNTNQMTLTEHVQTIYKKITK